MKKEKKNGRVGARLTDEAIEALRWLCEKHDAKISEIVSDSIIEKADRERKNAYEEYDFYGDDIGYVDPDDMEDEC